LKSNLPNTGYRYSSGASTQAKRVIQPIALALTLTQR